MRNSYCPFLGDLLTPPPISEQMAPVDLRAVSISEQMPLESVERRSYFRVVGPGVLLAVGSCNHSSAPVVTLAHDARPLPPPPAATNPAAATDRLSVQTLSDSA